MARPLTNPIFYVAAFVAPLVWAHPAHGGEPIVEVEEIVYRHEPANNGAGPMWCHGSTSIARVGNRVFVTGLETLNDVRPLNNCRWFLMVRTEDSWKTIYVDTGRTREPSPLAVYDNERLFVSANPTVVKDPSQYGGPSQPAVLEFNLNNKDSAPRHHRPRWDGNPKFSEHSYRSFAADPNEHELILFQNIGYTHAEWSFLDGNGKWIFRGKLEWPFGADYAKPQSIRVCYPNVALQNRAVYFCGVSDIQEPNPEWRQFKHELTGQKWDYDFRRLFFTWSPDIATGRFEDWVEISSREKTAGWITPGDLWVGPNGDVHVIWTERALDERLREKFFPDEKQTYGLYYARLRNGNIISRTTLVMAGEDQDVRNIPGRGRFHSTPDGNLNVFCVVNRKDQRGSTVQNWLIPIDQLGEAKKPKVVPLKKSFTDFFTATPRAGTKEGRVLDLFGTQNGLPNSMSYARIRLE